MIETLYRVDFDRVGRHYEVQPLITGAGNADELAAKIHEYARPFLLSRDVEITVNLDAGTGRIVCGFRNGGEFTVTEQDVRICIDADCPGCGWAERLFDSATGNFLCSQCDYVSMERDR